MIQYLLRLIQPIIDRIKAALGPFGKAIDLVGKLFTGLRDSFNDGRALAGEIATEISEWRDFKEAIPVRTGVISLPAAITKSKELLDQIRAAWAAIVDLAKQIQKQLSGQTESPTDEAKAAIEDIEASGFKEWITKFPRLAKGLEKVLGFLAIAVGVLETLQASISDLTAIVDAVRGIREEIETGSTIFLSHKNPRKTVKLLDGGSIKLRVGNLHS